jgi:hypothetical protein
MITSGASSIAAAIRLPSGHSANTNSTASFAAVISSSPFAEYKYTHNELQWELSG